MPGIFSHYATSGIAQTSRRSVLQEDAVPDIIQELKAYKRRFAAVAKAADACVFEVNMNRPTSIIVENSETIFGKTENEIRAEMEAIWGLSPEDYLREAIECFIHPDDVMQMRERLVRLGKGKNEEFEVRMRVFEGRYLWCCLKLMVLADEAGEHVLLGLIRNIHKEKKQVSTLEQEIQLDSFTRLYTKKRFEELGRSIIGENPEEKMALLFLDLDNFKQVNDQYGHMEGDKVLLSVAQMLRAAFRKQDIIARFGGDEFTILMRDIPDAGIAVRKAEGILAAGENAYGVTKSIGIAIYPEAATEYDLLMEKADQALYIAKKRKNAYHIYQ